MIYIEKGEEPDFLTEFKRKNPKKTYDSKEFQQYRGELTKVLMKEQKGICAYCCGKLKIGNVHNEHIEPRHSGKYESKRSLDYMNLLASCDNTRTCGRKKDNVYDEKQFISPLRQDCEEQFTYYPDGMMVRKTNGKEVTKDYTIELLNLNDYELRNARKATYKKLQSWESQGCNRDDIRAFCINEQDEYPAYYNVIKWYLNTYE